jgi:hypothetical protein
MANSKANIYPIQLQGAELNLNKFDAEIKQYSGFNKNNSPFVGGCLSNLFTKTEENTTGSSDSVYVDDNGDVYEAKTDGLYKNGEKVLPFNTWSDDNFLIFEELDLPSNTVFVRPIQVTTEDNKIYYKYFYITKEERDIISANDFYFKLHFDGVERSGGINLNCSITDVQFYVTDSLEILIRVSGINSSDNKVYMNAIAYSYSGNMGFQLYSNFTNIISVNVDDYINIPPSIILGCGSIYGLDETYRFSDGTKLTLVETGSSGRTTCIGKSKYYFYSGLYDSNYGFAYLVDVTNYTTSENQSVLIRCNVRLSNSVDQIIFDKDGDEAYLSASYSSGTTFSVKLGKVDNRYDIGGLCYALKFSDDKLFYGIAGPGIFTNQITLDEDKNGNKQAMMYMGVKSNCRLYNNGVLSGITIKDKLVTEWNSVLQNTVSERYQHDIVTYKSVNNKWYCVKFNVIDNNYAYEFKPKITKINNQLVLNKTGRNSYRLTDGKILYFAPDWNNRIFFNNSSITKSSTAITENAGYMATSINEYDLKDNASIILNPIPVIKLPSVELSFEGNLNLLTDSVINLYSGTDGNIFYKCTFIVNGGNTTDDEKYSWVRTVMSDKDLLGLPFPSSSDSNVQLSASLFCKTERFGNDVFIKEGSNAYQLIKEGSESVMSYYLGTRIDNLEDIFILQGQYYAIINKQIFNVQFSGGVVQSLSFVVSVENLQFCGNSAYQAYFFSKTNRCIYVFTGANILNQLQLVDKISEIYAYKYNQSTQSIVLITDIGTIVSSNLGMYLLEDFTPDDVFFYDKGVVFVSDSELKYLQYYESEDFEKHNIELETCFYGVSNETVSINDCLYIRLFSEEHEEGEIKISATTLANTGRKTEETTFKITSNDWDKMTHSLYLRYQPKAQRGLGVSFSINSPFKIASMSVGTQADAILIDKVSKGAINAPAIKSSNVAW